MARKKSTVEPSTFRFMCLKTDNKNYHLDFTTKEEAIQYADTLNDSKIEWYGIYELDPRKDYMIDVVSKRLIPHNDMIIVKPKEESKLQKRKPRPKKK